MADQKIGTAYPERNLCFSPCFSGVYLTGFKSIVLAPAGARSAAGAELFSGFSPQPVGGVFINPQPKLDDTPLDKTIDKGILKRRPDPTSSHWKIKIPLEELEDE